MEKIAWIVPTRAARSLWSDGSSEKACHSICRWMYPRMRTRTASMNANSGVVTSGASPPGLTTTAAPPPPPPLPRLANEPPPPPPPPLPRLANEPPPPPSEAVSVSSPVAAPRSEPSVDAMPSE